MSSGKGLDESKDETRSTAQPPAEGERRAMRGYVGQYARASAAIYAELERGQLLWIGVADRSAGIADDLVLGFDGVIVGHQFKTSRFPKAFTVQTLLVGADGLLKPLIQAWQSLRQTDPTARVEIRLVVNDFPSTTDKAGNSAPAHSAAFLEEFEQFSGRTLGVWQASKWEPLIDLLFRSSGLDADSFEGFLHALRILHGSAADFFLSHKLSTEQARLAGEIAKLLPNLVTDRRDKDRWSREEFLRELGWRDPAKTRHIHRFPVGAYVQRNRDTESDLITTLRSFDQGYVTLIGPPGSGKSTLLQTALATEPDVRLVRYLAFLPGQGQGVGRGEADDFLDDVVTQMRNSGLAGLRLRDNSLHERREQFGASLAQAGERFDREGVRTIIVVDGLDHIPREERPTNSLLGELPLPGAVPRGVIFVLGTQRLELAHLKPAVQEQAAKSDRQVVMRSLGREAVSKIADALGLDDTVPRHRLYDLSRGHPLATRYLIQALLQATSEHRARLLTDGMDFDGDIESVYASAWREISNDADAMQVLGFIARAEAPMPLGLLCTIVEERAIEHALANVGHLLTETSSGWSVFHNSFRLFILSKPRKRLGKVDSTYSERTYRDLAKLTRSAPSNSPQRWLELRYLARANDGDSVLDLATPALFREQLGQGRPVSEIYADIRLALLAARPTGDGTIVTRLLLCSDEVSRRTTALQDSDQLPLAMLAVGEMDAAIDFVQDFPNTGYEVVDALLDAGDFDRAKALFETLEPLSQLHTPRYQYYGAAHNLQNFKRWARRVFHFRDFDQILKAIDYLAMEGMESNIGDVSDEDVASVRKDLRQEVADSISQQRNGVDISSLCVELGIDQPDLVSMTVEAGFAAIGRGDNPLALDAFCSAMRMQNFDGVHNSWRRSIALFFAVAGHFESALEIFQKLVVPAISMGDEDLHSFSPGHLVQAVVEHAQLSTILGQPMVEVIQSRHAVLRPLQAKAIEIGVLMGEVIVDVAGIAPERVLQACRSTLSYLFSIGRNNHEFYIMDLARTTTPAVAEYFLKIAFRCGEDHYTAVTKLVDKLIYEPDEAELFYLRRKVAVAAYQLDGDTSRATERLGPLISRIQENTPTEQLNGIADFVVALVAVGDNEKALSLLSTVPDHCLGYAIAARKDPQYTVWRDVMVLANEADSEQRAQRVSHLMRQVDGMKETEGASAAHRLSVVLIDQAMQVGARFGADVAEALTGWQLIDWSNRIDAQMLGMLRRRPELAFEAVATWGGLCLPFYMEPHYRDPDHIGDFIDIAFQAVGPASAERLQSLLLQSIEIDGRAHERSFLLRRLEAAAAAQGHVSSSVAQAVRRWTAEAPSPRRSYSSEKYDDAENLDQLSSAFEADGAKLDYRAPYRFVALAQAAPIEDARMMYERWEALQNDPRSRFMMVKRFIQSGDVARAKILIQEYEARGAQRQSWSYMMGGDMLRYYEARVLLEGASGHLAAFEAFVDSLISGEDGSMMLLAEIDRILPVICSAPDWPTVWSLLAEQMSSTREYKLGSPFQASLLELTDEELLSQLISFAIGLPVGGVQRHALSCANYLARESSVGLKTFEILVNELLSGRFDEPLQALKLLLRLDKDLSSSFGPIVASLVGHRDVAVGEAAGLVTAKWGNPVQATIRPLPLFYTLELTGTREEDTALLDDPTGAMRVEDPLGWTRYLRPVAQMLAEMANTDEINIRQRAGMFIQEWGGIDVFGADAIKRLESKLRCLSMKLTYVKPHAWIGVVALRHVAGELRLAGLIPQGELSTILEMLHTPLPLQPNIAAQPRPVGISRPLISDRRQAETWANRVSDDLKPWQCNAGENIIAEVTRFKIAEARWSEYQAHRIYAPNLKGSGNSFWEWYRKLPSAVWQGRMLPLDNKLSPNLIRRVVSSFGLEMPAYPITVCPNWLSRLGWRTHQTDASVYIDNHAVVVAQLVFWRDAGPVDLDDDAIWGEGMYVALTVAGLLQFKAIFGDVSIAAFAIREARIRREDDKSLERHVETTYSV